MLYPNNIYCLPVCIFVSLSICPLLNDFLFARIDVHLKNPIISTIRIGMRISYVHLSVCLSVSLSGCLSVWLAGCLSLCLLVCVSVDLSVCLSVCLSVRLSVCLSVCLSVSVLAVWGFSVNPSYVFINNL